MCVHACVCMCMCICVYMYMCVCVYVCIGLLSTIWLTREKFDPTWRAHLATSPLGARHRAPSGDVCNYPNSHNIGGSGCRWGEGPWASARVLVIVIARPRTHDGMGVKKLHLLFVCLVLFLKARPLHRRVGTSNL